MEIDNIFQIIVIPAQTTLYHTTVRNKPDIDYDNYPNAQYLQPNEPYSTDLVHPKYMSISEDAAQYYSRDEDMVRLKYTTSRPIHLVDLYYPGHDYDSVEEANNKIRYLRNTYNTNPDIFPVDGYFGIDNTVNKFSEVYLFRPWSCLYADYELLNNNPYMGDYYGEDDNEQFLDLIVNTYTLNI